VKVELHLKVLKLVDNEASALVGTEFAGLPKQRELSIVVVPHINSRESIAERAAAASCVNMITLISH
jgi:hypothetical protein